MHHLSPQKPFAPSNSSVAASTCNKAGVAPVKPRSNHSNGHLSQQQKHVPHQNGPGCSHSSVPSWKRMHTPIGFDPKENLFRVQGNCKEYPEYNVKEVKDPRIQKFKANTVMELPVPDFSVDDQYTAVPTSREFSITGLNDNINEKFLRSLCKSEPTQVIVFHHPRTRRHLGLAFMDFNSKAESEAFIKKYNGKTLMGGKVNCFFDPLAYKISKLYEEATGGCVMAMPERYTHLVTSKSICRMRDLVKRHYGDGPQDDSPVFIKQESVKKRSTTPLQTEHPAATNGSCSAKKAGHTPSGSQPKPSTPATADLSLVPELNKNEEVVGLPFLNFLDRSELNSTCRTPAGGCIASLAQVCASLEHKEVLEATTISLNSIAKNDSKPASTSKSGSNKTRNRHLDDSDCSSSTSFSSCSSKTYSSSTPTPNYSTPKPRSSQKKSFNHHHRQITTEAILEKALQEVSSPSDSSPTHTHSQNNRSSSKHKSVTNGSSKSGAKVSGSSRKKRPSSRLDKKDESRKYRWSSSSSNDSRCSDSRKEHKTNKRKPKRPSTPESPKENVQNIQLPPPTPAPPNLVHHPKVSVQSPAITSTSSPTQPVIGGLKLHQQNLPPPGLIMPPTPVGLVPYRQTPLQKVEEVVGTPKPMSLEQRLNAMFKKGAIRKEEMSEKKVEIKLETAEEIVKVEEDEKVNPMIDLSMLSPSTSRVRDTISNHLVGSTSPRNPFRHKLMNLVKAVEVKQEEQEESEQARKARLDAQLVRERQQKIQRCLDVSRQARSTFSVEMIMVLHKDIQRRLEAEAFKILDEKFQALEEQRRKEAKQLEAELLSSAKHSGVNTPPCLNNLNQPLASLFPALDTSINNQDHEGMANSETIFGIPYQVRMASLPSFKKKKPAEVQSSYAREKLHHIKKRREQEESKRKAIKNKHQARSSSELSEDKMGKRKSKGSSQLVRRVVHKRSVSSSSSGHSRSSSASSSICVRRRKRNHLSLNASSRISSADEAEPITDSEEEETQLRKSEQQIEKEKEKTILEEKRAILDSLLKRTREDEDDDSCSLRSSLTPPPESLPGEVGKTSKADAPYEPNSSAPSTPPPAKKAKTNKELSSLLHSSSHFIAPQQPVVKKEPKLWTPRDSEAELKLLYDFETSNLSVEDCAYFKLATLQIEAQLEEQGLLPPGKKLTWITPSPAVKQPRELPTAIKKGKCEFYFDDHELEGIVPHKSGCARTEGYYKISKQRKTLMRRHEDFANRTIISTQDETAVRHMTQASKDERAMNRRLLTWIGDSTLVRVNQLKYRSKMIKFARSQIHGWGLYALETIPPEVMIIEYVGEKVRPTVADEREKGYELRGMGSSYMFRIDGDAVIDATKQGNFGRFINHSCSPNCTARVVLVDGDKRIVIYSKRLISKGEEITYDYKFAREEEASKIECLCGSKCCQKFLN